MSYTKVGPNKYRIFISDGFNLDGSRRRFSKTVTTDLKGRDLEKFLTLAEFDFEDEVKKKDPRFFELARGSFEAYSKWWLNYKKIEDKTKETYEGFLNLRIIPYIGNKILDKLTTGDMLELMEIIETTPSLRTKKLLSNTTIKHYHTLLKIMFNDAVTLKILAENPMDNVPIKSSKAKLKDNYYNLEDINKLLELLPTVQVKYRLAILLTISTGLRLGELSAIQWKHIDIDNCILTIEQSNQYAGGKSKIKDTKNEFSMRKITFPESLVDLIEEHRQLEKLKKETLDGSWYYENNKHEDDFVFTQENGKVIFKDTISAWFRKFRRKHNLKEITFHGLRHTSTTILISNGISVKNISSRLGHSRTSTTTDFYAHALESVEKESANIFNNILTGTRSGTEEDKIRIVK